MHDSIGAKLAHGRSSSTVYRRGGLEGAAIKLGRVVKRFEVGEGASQGSVLVEDVDLVVHSGHVVLQMFVSHAAGTRFYLTLSKAYRLTIAIGMAGVARRYYNMRSSFQR